MWLGGEPPEGSAALNNILPSQAECEAVRDILLTHPGVESGEAGLLPQCRQLCGPGAPGGVCACEEDAEYWLLDSNPLQPGENVDLMGALTAPVDHGEACARCVETSLCVRWERARGRSEVEAWGYCALPPENIVELQQGILEIIRSIVSAILEFFRDAKT